MIIYTRKDLHGLEFQPQDVDTLYRIIDDSLLDTGKVFIYWDAEYLWPIVYEADAAIYHLNNGGWIVIDKS